MKRIGFVATLLALGATNVGAQVAGDTIPADSVVPLDAVVVSAVRPATTTGGSSGLVVRPDSLHVVPAPTLEQVLRELPFIALRANSRGQAEITVRGSDSRQVAVLLDGIPVTLGWDHRTDPSIVPVTGAHSITVIRGLHSVLYGPNVLGGVVEIGLVEPSTGVPRSARATGRVFAAGVDDRGGTSLSAVTGSSAGTVGGSWELRAGAGARQRSGVAVPASAGDTLTREPGVRANSDLRHLDGFLSARYHADGGAWIGLTGSGSTSRRGVPPELHVAAPRLWRYPEESRMIAIASGGTGHRRTRWGTGDVEVSAGLDLGRTRVMRYLSPAYATVAGEERGIGRTHTLRVIGDHTVSGGGTLTGAVTMAEVHHREQPDDEAAAEYRQRLWSMAGEVVRPLGPAARVSGGLALDGASTPESGGRPPLGRLDAWGGRLGASSLVGENVRLHVAMSRRARFPSLRELYSGALGRFDPNPDLRPETLSGAEAGLSGRAGAARFQAVAFHHHLAGAISRVATADGKFRRVNHHAVRSSGVEVFGEVAAGSTSLRGDVLLQEVEMLEPGGGASPRRVEHQPAVRAGGAAELPLFGGVRGIATGTYTGAQFCVHPDTGGDTRVAPGAALDLGVQRTWRRAGPVSVSAFLDNATDAAVFDQCGLPRPGRTFRISVRVG